LEKEITGRFYFIKTGIDRIAHERGLDQSYISNWQEDISSLAVWRCADFILKERQKCLRIWIGAEEGRRMSRLYDEYRIRNGSLSDKIRIVDGGHASYYKRCTGQP